MKVMESREEERRMAYKTKQEKQCIQEYNSLLRCVEKQHETNGLSLHFSQLKSFHKIRLKNKC